MKKIIFIFIFVLILSSCNTSPDYLYSNLNDLDYSAWQELDFPLHSYAYSLIRLSDFKVLSNKNNNVAIYPASLTKILTMDTVLTFVDDLNDTSLVTNQQVEDLIKEDASLAYIQRDYEYSIEDLLYALILPSGADGAVALENYFEKKDMNLVKEMNALASSLGCKNSNFVNTTGLHDDNHYTCIDDLQLIIFDVLNKEKGRQILESLYYEMTDGTMLTSSLAFLSSSTNADILGGKTGFTDESGQSVVVLGRKDNRSYLLILCNAYGSYRDRQYWHYDDARTVFDYLP